MNDWWETFFDEDYLRIWGQVFTDEVIRSRLRNSGRCSILTQGVVSSMHHAAGAGSPVGLHHWGRWSSA